MTAVGQHMHFWSIYAPVLSTKSPPALPAHTPPPSTEQKTSTWAECAGLSSLVVNLGLMEMRSFWDQCVPRLLFSFSSFNATELRILPLLMSLHCSTWLLHQKRKESFDLDMPFFSVPLYILQGNKNMIKCISDVSPFREEHLLLSDVFPKPLMPWWSPSWTVRPEHRLYYHPHTAVRVICTQA